MTVPLQLFRALPLGERFHVWARAFSAPLEAVAERIPAGRVADVGCGHGLFTALLAWEHPERSVMGVDPDGRKMEWARQALGALPNVELCQGGIEALSPAREGTLDAISVLDVLYLLPVGAWAELLAACRRLLRPGGRLVLKEVEARASWKYVKIAVQEAVMVKLLGRTQSSGGLNLKGRDFLERLLQQAGFRVLETADLSRGYSTPHVLLVAEAPLSAP